MKPQQLTITVERGRISSITPNNQGVRIISEQGINDYPSAWILPGLVDAHCHVYGFGEKLNGLQLYRALSAEECIQHCKDFSIRRGDWLFGMGWNQELWSENSYPTKALLDFVFPDTPVYLRRADGHAAWVNSEALRRAGINSNTQDPSGGSILRDKGEPTGILIDNAMNVVSVLLPEPSADEIKAHILAATTECCRLGLTEVHDMDVAPSLLPYYLQMAEDGSLPIRIQSYISAQNDEWEIHGCLPAGGEFMRIAGIKFFADGALGSRGAALLEQYNDDNHCGLMMITEEDLYNKAAKGIDNGWSIATHAIGDAANRMVINVYEQLRKNKIADDHTILRIEHVQIIHPDDIQRLNDNAITSVIQPIHCTSDAQMAKNRLGNRISKAYPWKTLLNHGLHPAGSSDFPIESANPFLGMDAFCRRIPIDSSAAWNDEECLSREQALLSYTQWAHEASGMEYRRGQLAEKFDADFTIIDRNICECNIEEIAQTKVLATYTAGSRRYCAE